MRAAVLALALAALAACASRVEWVKEGAGPEDLRAARNWCAADAQEYSFMDVRGRNTASGPVQSVLYRECMESLGWRRARVDETPRAR